MYSCTNNVPYRIRFRSMKTMHAFVWEQTSTTTTNGNNGNNKNNKNNNNNFIVQRHVQAKRRIASDDVFQCVCMSQTYTWFAQLVDSIGHYEFDCAQNKVSVVIFGCLNLTFQSMSVNQHGWSSKWFTSILFSVFWFFKCP